jgi:MoaA/NifB/PqqE/SkfB family radical SAM enzyme
MCNALCLGCARTDIANFNKKRPMIPNKAMLSVDIIVKAISEFRSITDLDFCGTVDDPFMHPDFDKILQAALDNNVKRIFIHTNGSIRNIAYWKKCADILKQFEYHELKFSVDGLSDTNHLYRQHTNFDKIMENAEAFIEAGGNAVWQFLVFPWNEHQVDDARQLSKSMGFSTFIVRNERSIIASQGLSAEDVRDIKADNAEAKPANSNPIERVLIDGEDIEDNEIDCFFQKEKMYFIDFDARVWPCCFLRNTEFFGQNTDWKQVKNNMYDVYDDPTWNRIDMHTAQEILNHPFYANDLAYSFSEKYGLEPGKKIVKCAKTCSKKGRIDRPIGGHIREEHK